MALKHLYHATGTAVVAACLMVHNTGESAGALYPIRAAVRNQAIPRAAWLLPCGPRLQESFMRILLAEDDPSIAEGICASLRHGGHAVDHVASGSLADSALRDHDYDLLVLDLGLPSLDGSEVLRRLRSRGTGLPVLVVTARDGLPERIRVLDLGADDYLVKPFALSEFEARVRALLRRASSQGKPELLLGSLRLDLPGHRAWIDQAPLELTAREFGLLEALALRADRVTSRAQLIEALCDWDQELTDNGLDIAIHRLRRKLQGSGTGVRTIRGLGYLLEEAEASASDPA
jgi:two-component system OmpR family response regulator